MQVRRGGALLEIERRTQIDDLGVAGPLEHDVRRLQVAVDDAFAVQCRQGRQAIADNRNRNARLQTRLHRPVRDDHLVDVLKTLLAYPVLQPLEHLARQQPREIVAVHPFHLHHADAAAVHPVMNVQQIVLLDQGHPAGNRGHPRHRLVVRPLVLVAFGREDLQRHRQGETVGPAPLGQVHHPLPARTQAADQPVVVGPTQPLLFDDLPVAGQQLVRAARGRAAPPSTGRAALQVCCRTHRLSSQVAQRPFAADYLSPPASPPSRAAD